MPEPSVADMRLYCYGFVLKLWLSVSYIVGPARTLGLICYCISFTLLSFGLVWSWLVFVFHLFKASTHGCDHLFPCIGWFTFWCRLLLSHELKGYGFSIVIFNHVLSPLFW